MKTGITILILIFFSLPGFSQVISGAVFDNDTKKQIPNAIVFFNSTTIGTYTDEHGNFKLILPDNQKLPISVTSIGYTSVLESDYTTVYPIKIFMKPKMYELDEVHIFSKMSPLDRYTRKQHLNRFKEQFLGKSLNARKCDILNEKDLVFQYSAGKDILQAYSRNPLIINNKALGYQIIFYLDKFEYSRAYLGNFTYLGNCIFKEDKTLKGLEKILVERRRRLAYLGSRMQFFRSLWENKLDSAGFNIKNNSNETLTYDSLVVQTNPSNKHLKYKWTANISYYSKRHSTSILLLGDSVSFDKLGYFDPRGINWVGEMLNQRMGDELPLDYKFK